MKTVIVDIDGTISDGRHRLHFVRPAPGVARDYEAFHSRCGEDPVIASVYATVWALAHNKNQIVFCTGRPNIYREATQDWLDDNNVPYDELHMKPLGDSRPAPEYKLGVLKALQAKGHEVFLAIEDQPNVVAMWRANGIHCLQTQAN